MSIDNLSTVLRKFGTWFQTIVTARSRRQVLIIDLENIKMPTLLILGLLLSLLAGRIFWITE